jgi:hypothetical protein
LVSNSAQGRESGVQSLSSEFSLLFLISFIHSFIQHLLRYLFPVQVRLPQQANISGSRAQGQVAHYGS